MSKRSVRIVGNTSDYYSTVDTSKIFNKITRSNRKVDVVCEVLKAVKTVMSFFFVVT
jgi:hypothetical protein